MPIACTTRRCPSLLVAVLTVASLNATPLSASGAIPGRPFRQTVSTAITLTVLYDNLTAHPPLQSDWGFAVLVETPTDTLLLDTGADGRTLLENMRLLGKNPRAIKSVVFSHAHADHVGGLRGLLDLGVQPSVYVPEGFRASVQDQFEGAAEIIVTTEGQEIVPGIRTTGRVGTGIAEQALILDTANGPLLITGCAHPGVVAMVDQAMRITGREITEVLGGFHLLGASVDQVQAIAGSLRSRGVARLGPGHCTDAQAIDVLRTAYGEDTVELGAGRVLGYGQPTASPRLMVRYLGHCGYAVQVGTKLLIGVWRVGPSRVQPQRQPFGSDPETARFPRRGTVGCR